MTDSSRSSQSSEENEVSCTPRSEKVDNYSECFESDAESEVTIRTKQSSAMKTTLKKSHNHQKMKRPNVSLRITPSSDIERKILSVRKLHNNELRNMNGDLLLQIEKQKEEIRLLKRMELRQAKIIEKFDNSKIKLPSLIDSHNKELKMLREQIRNLKFRYRKSEESLREADAEIERMKNKLNKYKILLEEEQLIDRAELTRKLIHAEQKTEESGKKIQNLQNHTEHLINNHKHELNLEKSQNKKLRISLQNLEEKFSQLELQLLEKEKELEVWNIYSNRQKAGGKLNGSFSTPRSTSVKNKFNEKIPPMTPPFHRVKKYEEGRRQKEFKRVQEKLATKDSSTARNAGNTKNVQNIDHPSKTSNTNVLMSEKQHGSTEKISEKSLEESKEKEKKDMKFMFESFEREQELAEQIDTDNKQMENRKETEKMSANDDLDNKLEKSKETKPKEEIPKMAPKELKQVSSDGEMAGLEQKQDERRKKDMLLAKLKEIDDNPEMPLKSETMLSSEDLPVKADNKTHYSFSQKTENLHHGRPVNEYNSNRRNSPLTLNGFSENVTTPLEIKNDLFLLKKNDSFEHFFASNISLDPQKPVNEFQGSNGDANDAIWHQKSVGKNKNSIFKELSEDTPQDNVPNSGDFLGFKYSDGDSNHIDSSESNFWDVSDMLRNDSRNNEKHSTKLLPSRQQMNRFEKRPTLNSLDNSIDSVEEIIL